MGYNLEMMTGMLKTALFTTVLAAILVGGLFFPGLLSGQTAEAVDPFYKNLLEEGRFFYANGKPAEAIENLEVAFFGFLDSADKLAECYVLLTVCHFQMKTYDKVRFYAGELQRLKLEDRIPALALPEGLAEKYAEITAKLNKS